MVWEWGLNELSEATELLVSELTTNAMRVSQALDQDSPIRLWLLSDKTRLLILVWDGNPRPPVQMDATADAESGRGLVLVDAISEQWGWHPAFDLGGKWVWCRLIA
jgi:anti-sigma regulatory factor (Ser/Thr protein kinase)